MIIGNELLEPVISLTVLRARVEGHLLAEVNANSQGVHAYILADQRFE